MVVVELFTFLYIVVIESKRWNIMSKSESKYFNTAKKMDEAFLELINKKDYEYITVKEICAKANVNRSTFYLHYETMEDLLRETIEYHQQTLIDLMKQNQSISERIQKNSLDTLYFLTNEYLEPYLRFIKENKKFFIAVLNHPHVFYAVDTYKSMENHIFFPIMEQFQIPQEDRKYILAFYIRGLMSIIAVWLKQDCEDSIEHVMQVMQKCVQKIGSNQ